MDWDPIGGSKKGQAEGHLPGFEPNLVDLRPIRRTGTGGGGVRISTLWSGVFGAVFWRHGHR